MPYLLDTNHLSVLQRRGLAQTALLTRLEQVPTQEVATTIVCLEEEFRGWMAYLASLRSVETHPEAYRGLQSLLANFAALTVLPFDASALEVFQALWLHRIRGEHDGLEDRGHRYRDRLAPANAKHRRLRPNRRPRQPSALRGLDGERRSVESATLQTTRLPSGNASGRERPVLGLRPGTLCVADVSDSVGTPQSGRFGELRTPQTGRSRSGPLTPRNEALTK